MFISIIRWLRNFELFLFGYLVCKNIALILKGLRLSVVFWILIEFLLVVCQFVLQKSVNGIFWFLGERNFDYFSFGIARENIFHFSFLRPYGSFSHPNSLASFMFICFLFVFYKSDKRKFDYLLLFLCLFTIILSFSKTVIVFLIFFLIYRLIIKNFNSSSINKIKTILLSSILVVFVYQIVGSRLSSTSFTERISGINYSVQILRNNYLIGVGANNYLLVASKEILNSLGYLQLQPVHNIYLILLSEYGIFFLFLFILLIYKLLYLNKGDNYIFISIIFIVISGLIDHYWLTLIQNQLLMVLLFGLAAVKVICPSAFKKSRHNAKTEL